MLAALRHALLLFYERCSIDMCHLNYFSVHCRQSNGGSDHPFLLDESCCSLDMPVILATRELPHLSGLLLLVASVHQRQSCLARLLL